MAPDCDESLRPELTPLDFVQTLAREKARSIKSDKALIIGSDQLVELDGKVLGKPGTPEKAVQQLLEMKGRSHRLITAVAVFNSETGDLKEDVDIHVLHMRELTKDAIERYVHQDQPLNCAGSYMLEKQGIALFDRIEADPSCADDTAIIGLPIIKTLALLRSFGFDPVLG
jgi:septum formation protein